MGTPDFLGSERASVRCLHCGQSLGYLRVTTPEGLPDFIFRLSPSAWIGWSEYEGKIELVATCNRSCLDRYLEERMYPPEPPP
jgi:hypothetical protein